MKCSGELRYLDGVLGDYMSYTASEFLQVIDLIASVMSAFFNMLDNVVIIHSPFTFTFLHLFVAGFALWVIQKIINVASGRARAGGRKDE